MPTFAKIAASSVAVLLLAGCSLGAPTTNTTPAPTSNASTTTTNSAKPVIETAGGFTVTLHEYSITPSSVTLSKGQATTITVSNAGAISHSYVSPELGIDVQVPAGQTKTVSVTPTTTGTFEVHCSVAGHKDLGMHGTITVQ